LISSWVFAIWRLVFAISSSVVGIYRVVFAIYRWVHRDLVDGTGDFWRGPLGFLGGDGRIIS
jgi:hypothetical protein